MTPNPPLTPEEQAALADLNYRAALAEWQENEDARVAGLAVLAPLDDAVDLPLLFERLALVENATSDFELRARAYRIRTILTHDLGALLDELARLKVAAPEPVAPETPETPEN